MASKEKHILIVIFFSLLLINQIHPQIVLLKSVKNIVLGESTYQDVIKEYGQPDSVQLKDGHFIGKIFIDKIKILYYLNDGLIFFIEGKEVDKKNSLINEVAIFKPCNYSISEGIFLGMSKDSVDLILKDKYYLQDNSSGNFVFSHSSHSDIPIALNYIDGKLERINLFVPKTENKKNIINNKKISFSGNGISSTKQFSMESSWTLNWKFVGNIFQVYLYSVDSGDLLSVLVLQTASGSGNSFYPDPGKYYLKVVSNGEWNLEVLKEY